MQAAFVEILVICFLVLINGLLAMSEISVVSARRARLQQQAEEGNRGAREALALAVDPSKFLSTVQVGITLVGVLASAFGGATLAAELELIFAEVPLLAPYGDNISLGLVVVFITFLTLIFGELVPKRIGLSNAEVVAARIARPMRLLSWVTGPLVRLLGWATDQVLRVFGIRPLDEPTVTEEEIIIMLEQAALGGSVEPIEETMVGHVFRLGDRKVSALLTPRPDIVFISLHDSPEVILEKVETSGHSRFPVVEGDLENVIGFVLAKKLLVQSLRQGELDVAAIVDPPLFVPEGIPALDLLEQFRKSRQQIAIVIDEYGGLEGLVTINDILESIVGDIPEPGDGDPQVVVREDGSLLIDGRLPIDEFLDLLAVKGLPDEELGAYQTVGGLVMTALERVPHIGDHFLWAGWQVEVVDMDGRRVDRVLVSPPSLPGDRGETAVSPLAS